VEQDRSGERFTREDRLRRRSEFDRVYSQGRRAWTPGFSVIIAPGETGRHRLGLTVGRQVGNAVVRNRVKRRLREAFRRNRQRLPGCYDIVVQARREAAGMPYQEITEALVGGVRRAEKAQPARRRPRPGKESARE
jgi:ribonuclease P protein component